MTENEWVNSAFYDAYFSNYIEGTRFLVSEAKDIVFNSKLIEGQLSESHDVLGTYRLISDPSNILTMPENPDHFIELLKNRHHQMMGFREEIIPGEFKQKNNQAGNTIFVDFELVEETLKKGFNFYHHLDDGFQKAAFIMFLISEVHPFNDGNGRISRVFMNAEMASNNNQRIIIPTVYRDDYLLNLRALSRDQNAVNYIRMLKRAADFSASINYEDIDITIKELEDSNAFKESNEGILIFKQK